MATKLTKDNVFQYIDALYTKSYHESPEFKGDIPNWFIYLINYWNDRDDLLELYGQVGIELPKSFMQNFQHPIDWDKETLHLFIDKLSDHYVCNSRIYSINLDFWYKRMRSYDFNTKKWLSSGNYTEAPWQFVLRNPQWNDTELVLRIIDEINSGRNNSTYFFALPSYVGLSDRCIDLMLKYIQWDKLEKYGKQSAHDFIKLVMDSSKQYSDSLYEFLYSRLNLSYCDNDAMKVVNLLPNKYKIAYLSNVAVDQVWKVAREIKLSKHEIAKVLETRL